jgi:glycerol-3-phosphate dehydrogenase
MVSARRPGSDEPPRPRATGSWLNGRTRARGLERLAQQRFDVVVVGGGITGAGVALDAAARGLRTALVERVDLAAGTSRWSSKLVHGGLRYLVKGQLAIAHESAVERHLLLTRTAPHLVRPVPNLVPVTADTSRALAAVSMATVVAADLLRLTARTPRTLLPRPRWVGGDRSLELAPALRRTGLRGSILYWDGQLEDDARLVVDVARTAAWFGAEVLTRCAAVDVGEDRVTVRDELTGGTFEARGWVVNATGVWAAEHDPDLHLVASRGSHLVVPAGLLGHPRAVVSVPVPGHFGRFVLAIPISDGLVLLGLTDTPAPGADGIAPPVPEEDVAFILGTVSAALERPLAPSDVVGRFAGLRPLVSDDPDRPPADLSRSHLLHDRPGAPVTIAGGKLTTYRRMAQDAVDAVCRRAGADTACRTRDIPLVGAASTSELAAVAAPDRLVRRYGIEAPDVVALADAHPRLAEPVSPECPTTGAELLFGVLREGALTVEDLVERRTRVGFDEANLPAARAASERVLELAAELQRS